MAAVIPSYFLWIRGTIANAWTQFVHLTSQIQGIQFYYAKYLINKRKYRKNIINDSYDYNIELNLNKDNKLI